MSQYVYTFDFVLISKKIISLWSRGLFKILIRHDKKTIQNNYTFKNNSNSIIYNSIKKKEKKRNMLEWISKSFPVFYLDFFYSKGLL